MRDRKWRESAANEQLLRCKREYHEAAAAFLDLLFEDRLTSADPKYHDQILTEEVLLDPKIRDALETCRTAKLAHRTAYKHWHQVQFK